MNHDLGGGATDIAIGEVAADGSARYCRSGCCAGAGPFGDTVPVRLYDLKRSAVVAAAGSDFGKADVTVSGVQAADTGNESSPPKFAFRRAVRGSLFLEVLPRLPAGMHEFPVWMHGVRVVAG